MVNEYIRSILGLPLPVGLVMVSRAYSFSFLIMVDNKSLQVYESQIDYLSDVDFIEIIRDFPTIYNRSSRDFKDKTKEENRWKAVAEKVNGTVEEVKRSYDTIWTQFGKYIKKRKEKSGSCTVDLPLDPTFAHMMWLKNFIISR